MPKLVLHADISGKPVSVLADDQVTLLPPPEDCFYQVYDNWQYALDSPKVKFILEVDAFGSKRLFVATNPYGHNLIRNSISGRIERMTEVSFGAYGGSLTSKHGQPLATDLKLLWCEDHARLPYKIPVAEGFFHVAEIDKYVHYWYTTCSLHNYLQCQQQYNSPDYQTWQQFASGLKSHIKATRRIKTAVAKTRFELQTNSENLAEIVDLAATATTELQLKIDYSHLVNCAKVALGELASKYKIILTEESVNAILDDIIAIYSRLSQQNESLEAELNALFLVCPMKLSTCMIAITRINEPNFVFPSSICSIEINQALTRILVRNKAEDFTPEEIQYLQQNKIDEILYQCKDVTLYEAARCLLNSLEQPKCTEGKTYRTESITSGVSSQTFHTTSTLEASPRYRRGQVKKTKHNGRKPSILDEDVFAADYTTATIDVHAKAKLILSKLKPQDKQDAQELAMFLRDNPVALQHVSTHEPTFLMQMFIRRVKDIDLISVAVSQSEQSLMHKMGDGKTIMHYWVECYEPDLPKSLAIFKVLYPAFAAAIQNSNLLGHSLTSLTNLNYVPLIEYLCDNSRQNFMHILASKVRNKQQMEEYLRVIMPGSGPARPLTIAGPLLLSKNRSGENVYCILKRELYKQLGRVKDIRRHGEFVHAYQELKQFYLDIFLLLDDPQSRINPSSLGNDIWNFMNFDPNNDQDPLCKLFNERKVSSLEEMFMFLIDRGGLHGFTLSPVQHVSEQKHVEQTATANKILSPYFAIISTLFIRLLQRDAEAAKKLMISWATSKSPIISCYPLLGIVLKHLSLLASQCDPTTGPGGEIADVIGLTHIILDLSRQCKEITSLTQDEWYTYFMIGFYVLTVLNIYDSTDPVVSDHITKIKGAMKQICAHLDVGHINSLGQNVMHSMFFMVATIKYLEDTDFELLAYMNQILFIDNNRGHMLDALLKHRDHAGDLPHEQIEDPELRLKVLTIFSSKSLDDDIDLEDDNRCCRCRVC